MVKSHTKQSLLFGLLAAGLLLPPSAASRAADEIGDPTEGHRIASTWCVNCHVIDPASHAATSTGAPPFKAIANTKSITALSLRVFLQTPHNRMPDLHLTREETDDLIGYIFSLRDH